MVSRKNKGGEPVAGTGFGTLLGAKFEFTGDIVSQESMRVEGRIKGNGDLRGDLVLVENCHWDGDITAERIVVEGTVEGDIHAKQRLELRSGAKVHGDISCPVIEMSVGAVCEGQVHMLDDSKTGVGDRPPATEKQKTGGG